MAFDFKLNKLFKYYYENIQNTYWMWINWNVRHVTFTCFYCRIGFNFQISVLHLHYFPVSLALSSCITCIIFLYHLHYLPVSLALFSCITCIIFLYHLHYFSILLAQKKIAAEINCRVLRTQIFYFTQKNNSYIGIIFLCFNMWWC